MKNKLYTSSAFEATVFVILAILVAMLDPMGLANSTDKRSVEMFNLISSPFFPQTHSKSVSIVLLNDESFDFERAKSEKSGFFSYPPTYRQYRRLLAEIAALGAKGVFVDLVLADERDGLFEKRQFLAAIERFGRAGMPVYFAHPASHVPDVDTTTCKDEAGISVSGLKEAASGLPFVTYSGFGPDYPLTGFDACTGQWNLSPAMMLYRDHCRENDLDCGDMQFLKESGQFKKPLYVQWADGEAALAGTIRERAGESTENEATNCNVRNRPFGEKIRDSLIYLADAVFGRIFDLQKGTRCISQEVLGAQTFMGLITANNETTNQLLVEFVKGRVVMIGLSVKGNEDLVPLPGAGKVPGVVYHAMAYENLMNYEDNYMRPSGDVVPWISYTDAFELLVTLMMFIVQKQAFNTIRERCGNSVRKLILYSMGLLFIVFAFLVGLEVAFVRITHFAPANWLGVFALGFGLVGFFLLSTIKDMIEENNKSTKGG